MMTSNKVKRLIGTGAIAFAFFSASLAMGTPVKADMSTSSSVGAGIQSLEDESPEYFEVRHAGYAMGYEAGNKAETYNSNQASLSTTYLPIPYVDTIYIQTFQEGYEEGYREGWEEQTKKLKESIQYDNNESILTTIIGTIVDVAVNLWSYWF